MKCDQCELLRINGVVCHEIGCPNFKKKKWIADRGWVRFAKCRECGNEVEEGETCCEE